MLNIIGEKSSVFNRFMQEIRDIKIQKDPMRFRVNLERIGEIFAYELSKQLESEKISVETPLGIADIDVPKHPLVLATLLRAGLPLHQGLLNMFDQAENAFITAYRKYSKDGVEYIRKHFPQKNVTLWVGAIDDELTVKSYIVPGLGDAGDLAYGKKL